jgi:predicted RNase H-like HicB family nuclease
VLSIRITYWRDEDMWLGYLDEFPEYMTQGYSFADLKDHLIDLMRDLESGIHIIASA